VEVGPIDGHDALFERLTEPVEHRWRELGEFVEEQDTAMRELR
jgi:hypothetical protein